MKPRKQSGFTLIELIVVIAILAVLTLLIVPQLTGYTKKSQANVQNKYIRVTTDVKLEGVAVGPLMKFIFDLERSSDLVRIQYLRITKGLKGTDTYDAIIKVDSFINK